MDERLSRVESAAWDRIRNLRKIYNKALARFRPEAEALTGASSDDVMTAVKELARRHFALEAGSRLNFFDLFVGSYHIALHRAGSHERRLLVFVAPLRPNEVMLPEAPAEAVAERSAA